MSFTNRYDPDRPEHKAPCQRTACADREPHPGGRHLDQRDELYDGPRIQLQATSMYVRDSAWKIIREAPALTPEVIDLITYIGHLEDQATAARVDRDRGIREAGRRALDCAAHGEEIEGLQALVHGIDESGRRSEAGRVVLLGFLHAVDKAAEHYREGYSGWTIGQLVDALEKSSRKARAAHERAWKR